MRENRDHNPMPKQEGKVREIAERLDNEPVFGFLKDIQREFPESEMYLVGGAVRDLFLDRPCKDYDFIVRGVEPKSLQEFLSRLGIVNLVGRNFGVFKFVPESHYEQFKSEKLEPFDLALPTALIIFFSKSFNPPKGSIISDPPIFIAIALIVKSRRSKSFSIGKLGSD